MEIVSLFLLAFQLKVTATSHGKNFIENSIRNTEMYYKKKCPVPVYKQVFLSAGKPKLVLFCFAGFKKIQNHKYTEFH